MRDITDILNQQISYPPVSAPSNNLAMSEPAATPTSIQATATTSSKKRKKENSGHSSKNSKMVKAGITYFQHKGETSDTLITANSYYKRLQNLRTYNSETGKRCSPDDPKAISGKQMIKNYRSERVDPQTGLPPIGSNVKTMPRGSYLSRKSDEKRKNKSQKTATNTSTITPASSSSSAQAQLQDYFLISPPLLILQLLTINN